MGGRGRKHFNINGWVRHNRGRRRRSKNWGEGEKGGGGGERKRGGGGGGGGGGGVVHIKIILVPQKMRNKTSNLKMAVCKRVRGGCNQNPLRTPVNFLFFVKL